MEIWLKQDDLKLRLPVNPSEYEITSTMNNTAVNINSIGEINLLGKPNLRAISFNSMFPSKKYYYCQYRSIKKPKEYVKIVEKMKKNGVLRLTMTGTPVSMDCTIEEFVFGENDASKDINFTINFKEYKKVKIKRKTKKTINKNSDKIEIDNTKRLSKSVKSTTYTVKKNDTLSAIAKKLTGSSSNYSAIAKQNNITNPNKIYVGQKLVIKV